MYVRSLDREREKLYNLYSDCKIYNQSNFEPADSIFSLPPPWTKSLPRSPFNRILISAREDQISPASTVGRISPAAPEGRISPAAPEGRISPLWAWAGESAVRADAEFRWRRVGTAGPFRKVGCRGMSERDGGGRRTSDSRGRAGPGGQGNTSGRPRRNGGGADESGRVDEGKGDERTKKGDK